MPIKPEESFLTKLYEKTNGYPNSIYYLSHEDLKELVVYQLKFYSGTRMTVLAVKTHKSVQTLYSIKGGYAVNPRRDTLVEILLELIKDAVAF